MKKTCKVVFYCEVEDKFYLLLWRSLHDQVCNQDSKDNNKESETIEKKEEEENSSLGYLVKNNCNSKCIII